MFMRVVLPAPFSPRSAWISPGRRRTGRDESRLDAGSGLVDLGLDIGRELSRRIGEGRGADGVVLGVEVGQAALGGAVGDANDRIADGQGEVLLRAGQDAGLRGRIRLVLV